MWFAIIKYVCRRGLAAGGHQNPRAGGRGAPAEGRGKGCIVSKRGEAGGKRPETEVNIGTSMSNRHRLVIFLPLQNIRFVASRFGFVDELRSLTVIFVIIFFVRN